MEKVRITFLGGLGDIGRNCAAIETQSQILILDCGQLFPDEFMPGANSVLPDLTYLLDRKEKIVGCITTHAHEDHIGALPYLLEHVELPIYGSSFTLGMVKNRLEERQLLDRCDLIEVNDGQKISIGEFACEFLPVTHSVPSGLISAIETPQGLIVHSSDFKLDLDPIDGRLTDLNRIAGLSKNPGIRLLLCDSTNSDMPGSTISESDIGASLARAFQSHKDNRIIAACFASHIHRVEQIAETAINDGRKISTLGLSMKKNLSLARKLGILEIREEHIVDIEDIRNLPPNEVCIISTGTQAEPRSALAMASTGESRWISIGEQDSVILSSRAIPGNEERVGRMINNLMRRGASVLHADHLGLHTSGHGKQEELRALHQAANPEWFVPVHGEYRHLVAHKDLAIEIGLSPERILLATDGDQVELGDNKLELIEKVTPGDYPFVQGRILEREHHIFSDRRILGKEGCVIASVQICTKENRVLGDPSIVSKGWVNAQTAQRLENEISRAVKEGVEKALLNEEVSNEYLEQRVRRVTGGLVNELTGRRPMIVPIVRKV
ncbi:MAG: ribonuclease J [Acidimicrobiaceae bacterium]|nr:ribonuclease J [Acidimicrobiaceae bacterium]